MTLITMLSEDVPFALEVVTNVNRGDELMFHRKNSGALFFCEVCELDDYSLTKRGFTYEPDSGVIMCLHCLFDPTCNWQFIVRGNEELELSLEPVGRHRA